MAPRPILFIRDSVDLAALWHDAAANAFPQFDIRTKLTDDEKPRVAVALVWKPWPGFLASLPNLKLVVSVGAGVDHIVGHDTDFPRHVPLVRMVDPGLTRGMCDYVAWACLSVLRDAHGHRDQQRRALWRSQPIPTADQRCVGVFGLGQIGRAVAMRLHDLGFEVLGWSRTHKTINAIKTYCGDDGFSKVCGASHMVVNLLPATPQTQAIFDQRAFAIMQPGTALINAGRGSSVDEGQALAALDSGQLGAAYLDVFACEPLADISPLWAHPRVTITPHNAAITHPSSGIRAVERALDELAAGTPLSNLVDWNRGY